MSSDKQTTSKIADRICNALAFLSLGFVIGFGACAVLQARGKTPLVIQLTFQEIVGPLAFLGFALPQATLQIARFIRRHRRLASGSLTSTISGESR